jgi:hypothetical protein
MAIDQGHAVADELSADPISRREPLVRRDPFIAEQVPARRDSQIRRAPNASGLYDVLDLILDKGIVIDAFVRVSLVGIELLTVDLRIVIASVDTYLRYAEGVEKLKVYDRSNAKSVPELMGQTSRGKVLKEGVEAVKNRLTGRSRNEDQDDDSDGEEEENEGVAGSLTHGIKKVVSKGVHSIVDTFSGGRDDDDDEDDEEDRKHADDDRPQARERGPKHERRPERRHNGKSEQRERSGSRR